MSITPAMIKELRQKTGVGFGKCKEALVRVNGDVEEAIKDLRKAGEASAAKKEHRVTKEGMICVGQNASHLAIVEVRAETDFVVKNEKFVEFANLVAQVAAENNVDSVDSLLETQVPSQDATLNKLRSTLIQTIGENITVNRVEVIEKKANASYGFYLHMGGSIGTVVEIEGSDKLDSEAKDVAMHVAAAHPDFLNADAVPQNVIESEKEIAAKQNEGKPAQILEKILEGKVRTYFESVCLVNQKFIKDDKQSVEAFVAAAGKNLGATAKVTAFRRWTVGE